jgi:hypothetical protein
MRSTHTVFGTAIHGARGVLPWIILMALASALASAMSAGVSDLPGMREGRAWDSATAQSPSEPPMAEQDGTAAFQSTPFASTSARESCRLLYAGLNSWIPAEPASATCPDGGPELLR